MSRTSRTSVNKNDNILTTPLDFQKVNKHALKPPSLYSNQPLSSKSSGSIKTPSDFTLKQNTSSTTTTTTTSSDGVEKPREAHPSETVLKSEKTSSIGNCSDIRSHPADANMQKSKSYADNIQKSKSYVDTSLNSLAASLDAFVQQGPLPVMHTHKTRDKMGGQGECSRGENSSRQDECSHGETNSGYKENNLGYNELENLYIESKNKLEKLEMKFTKINEAKEERTIANTTAYGEKKGLDHSGNSNDFVKQLEDLRHQNQLLSGKLQMLEQCQFSDVKVVVDRYLSQNQYESEKDALNSKIIKLEKTVCEFREEKEKLLKDIEHKDEKYDKAMIRNKEERYSYEECMDKLNIRISEMIDENEQIRDEKEDILVKYESSVKTIAELNQIMETKNKCIDEVNMKLKEEANQSTELNNKCEKRREGFEAALANVERMLKEEVAINANLDGQLRQQDLTVQELEYKLRQLNDVAHESKYNNDVIKSLKNNIDAQHEENMQLQHLCQTLQSTNESLNVRFTSLNEVLRMQEPYTGIMNGDQNAKLLQMWREKVYSLLVLLKMVKLQAKHTAEDGDVDGGSSVL